ncbi:MAG TPA: hypothetical protein PKA27_03235 [Fimbriimonadaceae bacterium]|nr:hypothetical protein [Fimbriimonadaceae bacterium]
MHPIVAVLTIAIAPLSDWITDGGATHNYLNNITTSWEDFRSVSNFSTVPVQIESAEAIFSRTRSVTGSSNNGPPWSEKFATIADPGTNASISVTTPRTNEGNLAGLTKRTWRIRYTYEEGKQQWKHVPTNEVVSRLRNWHTNHDVTAHDDQLQQGGGGGN